MAEGTRNTGRGKQKTVVVPDMGRLQPQARELEEAVLGALMLEKDAYSIISEILKPECFYEKAHEMIYAAIVDLAVSQRPVDMLTVTEQLKKRGELDQVGGPFYISQLTSKVASSAHIEYHARIIAQKYLARELISFTAMIQGKAFDETIDVEDLMQEAEGKLFEISQRNVKKDVTQINPVIKDAMEMLQKAANQKEGLSGIRTGFDGLDKIIETRTDRSAIGFDAPVQSKKQRDVGKLLAQVQPHDLLKFGIIPELVGRLPVITALQSLTKEDLVRILTEPKNALVRQYQKLLELDHVGLDITGDALEAIAQKAIDRQIGARGLRAVMEETMMKVMYEIPSDLSIQKVIITADCVNGGTPELIRDEEHPRGKCQVRPSA